MVVETQWFVARMARASLTPKAPVAPGRRGYVPAIWEAIENRSGMWTGALPVQTAQIALVAVSYDTSIVDSATRASEWSKLQALSDARVFDLRDSIGKPAGSWSRDASFAARLDESLVDTPRFRNSTRTIRFHLRELARELLLKQFLGRHFYPLSLDSKFTEIAEVAWLALAEHLEEFGFPVQKIPNKQSTFRSFYRAAMLEPSAGKPWQFGAGFHLGHPEANLRGD